jgi:phosphopantothenoylcysteine decarboxylase/phosphopantothenate--cysteine ligase
LNFADKNILIAASGGIAAYKTAQLVRTLVKYNARVRVMMTPTATQFVSPLTFETLSGHPVLLDLFPEQGGASTAHIDWARWADVIVVCPATANTMAKLAHGLADNAVTTTLSATTAPVLLCPAMNKEMYASKAHQDNQKRLHDLGYRLVEPSQGWLACGEEGWGRLADLSVIIEAIEDTLYGTHEFAEKHFLISAGPTRENIDPVRYISNRSSGKMGYALARQAFLRGAQVTVVTGPTTLELPPGIRRVDVENAREMTAAIEAHYHECDVLLMVAAVADFRPSQVAEEKIKKKNISHVLHLTENPDILNLLAPHKKGRIHVGFSLETNNIVEHSLEKLKQKKLDLIIANNPREQGAGFDHDTNRVTIVFADGQTRESPLMDKTSIADQILDEIRILLNQHKS